MAESKDMHSSSPARAPKLQLAVEQPLTGECWKPPKRIPHVQKQRSHSKMVVGVQTQQNQIPYPPGGWPTDWRTIIPKKFSHYCEVSEPHIKLPSLEIWHRDWESPGNLSLSTSRIWLKDFQRIRGNRDSSLEEHKQNFTCTKTQRSSDPTGDWTETTS